MENRHIEAIVGQLHHQLGVDVTNAVDVFDCIRRLEVYLHFRPLKNLMGAYLNPDGRTPGILINSKHPLQLQRYTAAHELGHFWLNHEPTTDAVIGVSSDDAGFTQMGQEERDAELFAALFLMPSELVAHCATKIGIDPHGHNQVSNEEVLMLSLLLGTSYKATTNRIRSLGLIDADYRAMLQKRQPQDIKKAVGGFKPEGLVDHKITWNHVVVMDARSHSSSVLLEPDQVVQICLDTRATSGHIWECASAPEGVQIHWSTQRLAAPDVIGAGVRNVFTIVGMRPEVFILRFIERRPWQPERIRNEYLVRIQVQHARRGIDIGQLVC